ncbi:MAG: SH3 domain-containing protein [Sphingomonadaceae bacterium]|nr:SH3 domain-containing protein [Sphingomonadaceae bacterium]
MKQLVASTCVAALAFQPVPAFAKKDPPPELVKCEASLGTIALVDGDLAGWTKFGLGSPRELINALALESGCFTPHSPASGEPARFLVTAVAGDQEEVDKSVEMGKGLAGEALWRSGAAGKVLGGVPFGGAALGMFGGLGGKRKTVAAGLRVVSPANGMTVASGSGSVKKSTITFGGNGGGWAQTAASASGYQGNKNGEMLAEAFVIAFNQVVAQRAAMEAAPAAGLAQPAATSAGATVAVDTVMRASAASDGAEVRALRAGTALNPTGNRAGLFIEVTDNFGTKGWVSVEDLQ